MAAYKILKPKLKAYVLGFGILEFLEEEFTYEISSGDR